MKNTRKISIIFIACSLLFYGCQKNISPDINKKHPNNKTFSMQLTSPSFINNGAIPPKFTCQGANINPELLINNVLLPEAKTLALIMDDPDAPNGDWVHWVVWNIPADTKSIPENVGPKFAIQGKNTRELQIYGGPCPPTGIHRYFFRLFALSSELDIPPTSTKADLLKAMEGKILDETQLMGTYKQS